MSIIEENKEQRFLYLQTLYELLRGKPFKSIHEDRVQEKLGWDDETIEAASLFLKDEHLIEYTAMGPQVALTNYGIKEYERAMSQPERPTQFFPPIINIQSMMNSQLQIGSHGSSQVQRITQGLDGAALAALLSEIRSAELPASTRTQLDGILQVLEHEKQPQPSVVKALLGSAKAIIEGAGGTILAAKIAAFVGGIPGL
jgi:hypothetical protein